MRTSNRWSPAGKRGITEAVRPGLWLTALLGCAVFGARAGEGAGPPLDARGQAAYREFQAAPAHRAFVVAPGGVWAWRSGEVGAEDALEAAAAACRDTAGQGCVPYAVDERLVFDRAAWSRQWGPYASAAAARGRPVGLARGQRFHDLAWRTPAGTAMRLSDLRGKVVVLHFWGSWCRPCRQEMPEIEKLAGLLADQPDIRFVLLQAREDFATARRWAEQQALHLPLHDSGAAGEDREMLPLAGGGAIHDREVARVFPSSYVIDRHGLVLWSHAGPVADWPGLADLLRDAAARSGR